MPSHDREASRDRELVLRHPMVPMWDSSDPERAPPPLPMNPGSTSPVTKSNASPNIQAVAANFAEKMRESTAPSAYTTNPMPLKSSPEKSLIKGHYHKRMQSMQPADTRSEFLSYLESRSPERPLRASTLEPGTKQQEKTPPKSNNGSPSNSRDTDRDTPSYFISNRYLSKPILGEATPPSATMLALQNMQLPDETESPSSSTNSNTFSTSSSAKSHSFESLSSQILSLTNIASGLKQEMAQLSRRSKDNATDLVSLKAATNARDEDIRKSLRELSSSITSKFLELDGATRLDLSALFGSGDGIDNRASDSSPSSKKSYTMPRMPSPNPFAAAMEREMCGSPTPISDGSASIALLEKVLREMATKEGQEKLLELVDEIKSRPVSSTSENDDDSKVTGMLEEILNLVKEHSESKALVHARPVEKGDGTRSVDPANMSELSDVGATGGRITEEMLAIMKRVKSSVIEGGGMTNEVKALVRELRGEVLGMGRELARKLEAAESTRAIEEEKATAPAADEISAIVDNCLQELKEQMAHVINENREHSSALWEFRSAMTPAEIYSAVKKAVDEIPMPEMPTIPDGVRMEKEEILETVREAWETYRPEIELQNFGLERDEILECLAEGLKSYQPQHEQAITYDQVLAAIQAGLQDYVPPSVEAPPTISRDEIILTIRECLESFEPPTPRYVDEEQLTAIRDEILHAVTAAVTSQSELTRETFDSGIGRDDIMSALNDGLETHFAAAKEKQEPNVTKEDVINAINDAFAVQQSALSTEVQQPISREEVLAAIAEGLGSQEAREIELNKDDLMEAISSCLQEATSSANAGVGEQVLERLQELLEGIKEEFKEYSAANGKDTEQVLDALKDGLDAVRKEVESCTAAASDEASKHEIMDTVKEGFRLLQADMEKTIADAAGSRGSPDTPELLDAMEKEFEHLRQTISTLLIHNNAPGDKDEILDAIRDVAEAQKSGTKEQDVVDIVKEQIENLRETFNMSIVPAKTSDDKDEILAVLQANFEALREQTSQPKDVGESMLSTTSELLEAFHEGVDSIRADLDKLLNKPAEFDNTEVLETIREGLTALKTEMEGLRQSQREFEDTNTSRGNELMLANDGSGIGDDIESLKVMITQLQIKVEAIESIPPAEPSEDALKKEHLDEVLLGLHEVQESVAELVARPSPVDETAAKKEDTDTIETLLRETKAHLDEIIVPPPDEIAKAEQLGALEAVVKETKEAIGELSTRLEAEGPTKSEIGTLETLLKDMWIVLEELKANATPGEDQDTSKLMKSDLQTVEAMIFEVKTQVEELKLPDVETLPTKTDIQELSALVTEFREKVEAENELTAQAFEARKVEHGGLAEKIEEAKAVVGDLGDELKSKLDGSSEGLSELKTLLEGLAASAETFTTVDSIQELTDLINREFERARGEHDATKLETEERDAAAAVKHDETRAAVIVELGTKIDEKLGEVMTKYEEAQTAMESKFAETEERDMANLEAVTNTKSIAEDIKLVIGEMGNSVNETCERISIDTKAFFEKVDESYNKMEEMHNEVKTNQEQVRADFEKAVAATDRVESKLGEIHPQILESIQQILSIVGQHYEHSQRSTEDFRMDLSAIPKALTPLLPALPPPEPEKYDDSQVQEKLNTILQHASNRELHEKLEGLLAHPTNTEIHDKLNALVEHTTNTEVHDKLDTLMHHATNSNGPVHEKLDTLVERSADTTQAVTQMMKLDEMHKDIMETSRRMNEMFEAQSKMVAEDTERRRRESEEAAIALERRIAQREQVEAELIGLQEEKDSLLKMIHALKSEKDDLVRQNSRLSKDLSSMETALEIRHEEMQMMEERADSLEKRILEGVLDHARSVLLSRPNSVQGMKRVRGSRNRGPSAASNASTAKEARSILGSGVGIALKRRTPPSLAGSTVSTNTGKERRILSLSNVTGNRGIADRQTSANSGFANLKRSHSVKSDFSLRKASWGGRSSIANKENEVFVEEDERNSGDESDTGTERRTSYTGTCTDSIMYGTESAVSADRRTSLASTANGIAEADTGSVVDHREAHEQHEEEGEKDGDGHASESDGDDDANTTKADEPAEVPGEESKKDLEDTALFGHPTLDSGLGTEIAA